MKKLIMKSTEINVYQFNDLDKQAKASAKDQVRRLPMKKGFSKGYDSLGDYINDNFLFHADGEMLTMKSPISDRMLIAMDSELVIEDTD